MPAAERSTARLVLRPIGVDQLDAYVDLQTHLRRLEDPPRPPADPVACAGYLATFAQAWTTEGLGYWCAYLDGTVAGFGGVQPKRWLGQDCWNLYYQLFPHQTGRGLATELALAAIGAAAEVRPEWPVLVETRPTNSAAIAVAVRAGLTRRSELDADGWAVLLLDQ